MTISTESRKTYLQDLLDNGDSIRTAKVFYKDDQDELGVYKIELDYLIFNPFNDRVATEMATWQTEAHISLDEYDDEIHKKIAKFIWESNETKNEITLEDLRKRGQRQHGIVTLDGVIISGNRRFLLLSKLPDKHYFEAVILKDAYAGNESAIIRLETQYQYEDPTLEYGPLQKYMKVKRMCARGIEIEEIADLMGEKENKIREWRETMEIMDRYLDLQGYSGLYQLLKEESGATLEDEFLKTRIDLKNYNEKKRSPDWAYSDDDVEQLESILFDHIRFGNPGNKEKDFRLISNEGGGKKSLFNYGDIWKSFAETHAKEVDPITADELDFDEYCRQKPDVTSKVEAARLRDADWKNEAHAPIKRNFGQWKSRLDARVNGDEPTRLLKNALNNLAEVDYLHEEFTQTKVNHELVDELNSLIWKMKQRLSKARSEKTQDG